MSECVKCGQCCKQVAYSVLVPDELAEFLTAHYGHKVDMLGIEINHRCIHLTSENECNIYENRPSYCRRFQCPHPGQLVVKVEV